MVIQQQRERIAREGSPPFSFQLAITEDTRKYLVDLAEQFPKTRPYLPYNSMVLNVSGGDQFDFAIVQLNNNLPREVATNFFTLYPGSSLEIPGGVIRSVFWEFVGTIDPSPEIDLFLQRIPR